MTLDDTPFCPPPAALPRQASLQAVQWLVQLREAGQQDATLWHDWRQWLAAHPDHQRAWSHLQQGCAQLGTLPGDVAHRTLTHPGLNPQRRQVAKLLGLAGILGGAGLLARHTLPWSHWHADRHTGIGERASLQLRDGIALELNTATAIDLPDEQTGLVVFVDGEIMVTLSARSLSQPLRIATPAGLVGATEGRFSLRRLDDHVLARVFDGYIDVMPSQAPSSMRRLVTGEAADFSVHGIHAVTATSDLDAAWVRGMLVARDMPLSQFLAELSRYRHGRLSSDPAVADLPVSGIYPLHDSDRVLDMLARTHPIQLRQFSRYWVTVEPIRTAT